MKILKTILGIINIAVIGVLLWQHQLANIFYWLGGILLTELYEEASKLED